MQTRVVVFDRINDHDRANEWCLSFQRVRYVYENGDTEEGYRFIWIKPNGNLQAARGQARIPRLSDAVRLIQQGMERGWPNGSLTPPSTAPLVPISEEKGHQLLTKFTYRHTSGLWLLVNDPAWIKSRIHPPTMNDRRYPGMFGIQHPPLKMTKNKFPQV